METFSAFGSISASSPELSGIAGTLTDPITSTGASSEVKQFREILPARLSANEFRDFSSVITRHFPCLLTDS